MSKRTSILSLLSAQKQVWAKQLVAQKLLVKADGGAKELWSKLVSAQNDQTFYLQTAAFTRVLLRHQQLSPEFFCATSCLSLGP